MSSMGRLSATGETCKFGGMGGLCPFPGADPDPPFLTRLSVSALTTRSLRNARLQVPDSFGPPDFSVQIGSVVTRFLDSHIPKLASPLRRKTAEKRSTNGNQWASAD
jgi:hypothetical protein